MPRKKAAPKKESVTDEKVEIPSGVLTSRQEIIETLNISSHVFYRLLSKYPFPNAKLNGRWHVSIEDLWRWYGWVKAQEFRHPEARRQRPEEPPEIRNIVGR